MIRRPARILAPLALVACAVAVLVIVQNNGSSSNSNSNSSTTTTATGSSTTNTTKLGARKQRRTYTVRPGDVLSQIAIKTGVPLATIQQLNPNVDAQSLHAGQKLKLRP
jgi:LysM repeat protein